MIKGSTLREIRFRDGQIIGKGETILIHWPKPRDEPSKVEVLHRDRLIQGRAATSLAWIGYTVTDDALVGATMDGMCETPGGNIVEPDGVDADGTPSWLLIHGLM